MAALAVAAAAALRPGGAAAVIGDPDEAGRAATVLERAGLLRHCEHAVAPRSRGGKPSRLVVLRAKGEHPADSAYEYLWQPQKRPIEDSVQPRWPPGVAARLVAEYSAGSDLVVDPFAWAGCVGVAARGAGRTFFGAECDEAAYKHVTLQL